MTLLGEFVMSAKVAAKHHLGDLLQSLERLRDPTSASPRPPNEPSTAAPPPKPEQRHGGAGIG